MRKLWRQVLEKKFNRSARSKLVSKLEHDLSNILNGTKNQTYIPAQNPSEPCIDTTADEREMIDHLESLLENDISTDPTQIQQSTLRDILSAIPMFEAYNILTS